MHPVTEYRSCIGTRIEIEQTGIPRQFFFQGRNEFMSILAGYLLVQGYQILNRTNTYQTHDLYEYMKPLACSFTELTLNLEQIVRLPEDEELMDLVMERYISNLLADFQFFAERRLPDRDLTFRGFYLSRKLSRLVPCRPIERKLTPKFGTLAFAVTKNEIRTYIPSE